MILEVCFRGKRTKAANPDIKLGQPITDRGPQIFGFACSLETTMKSLSGSERILRQIVPRVLALRQALPNNAMQMLQAWSR